MNTKNINISAIKLLISSILCLTLCANTELKAQDPIFSLFESTAMNFNPSHVGNEDYSRVSIGYRNQYPTYKSPFVTYLASYDMYVDDINSGFGLQVMNDRISKGIFTTTSISLAYSYNLRVAENLYLRGGISVSYHNRKRDPNGLIFPDMPYFSGNMAYVSNYDVIKNSSLYVGFGGTLLYKRFKIGGAIFNLGGKSLSKSSVISLPNPIKATGYATVDIPLIQEYKGRRRIKSDVLSISPYVRYIRQYDFEDLDIGAYFNANMFFVGLAHRSDTGFKNSTFVVAAGIQTNFLNIGYSANFGNIGSGNRYVSAHEVSLIIKFGKKYSDEYQGIYMNRTPTEKQRTRQYKCPY